MEKIIGLEYSYDKNGIIVYSADGKIGVKMVLPFLNLKFAKDWVKKSAFERAGEDGDCIIDDNCRKGFAYNKNGLCIGGWYIFAGKDVEKIPQYFLDK